jgi:hypothetical protein
MVSTRRLGNLLGFAVWTVMLALAVFAVGSLWEAVQTDSGRSRSDRFWAAIHIEGVSLEHYEDLADMTTSADLVVVGQISRLELGRRVGEPDASLPDPNLGFVYFATATLEVERYLGGRQPAPSHGTIHLELLLPHPDVLPAAQELLGPERGIYWLRDKAASASRLGWSADAVAAEAGRFRMVSEEGLVREFAGRAIVAVGTTEPLRQSVEDRAFDQLVSEVVQLSPP